MHPGVQQGIWQEEAAKSMRTMHNYVNNQAKISVIKYNLLAQNMFGLYNKHVEAVVSLSLHS